MSRVPTSQFLKMHAVMWPMEFGERLDAFRYEVTDHRGVKVAFITNQRATGRTPSWKITVLKAGRPGEPCGDHATADAALEQLQSEFQILIWKGCGCEHSALGPTSVFDKAGVHIRKARETGQNPYYIDGVCGCCGKSPKL